MSESTSILRVCTSCESNFPATTEYFYKLKTGKHGLSARCKICTLRNNSKHRKDIRCGTYKKSKKIECVKCGAVFRAFPSELKKGRKYCSTKCANDASITTYSKNCEFCGKEYADKRCKMVTQKFCSPDCFNVHKISLRPKVVCVICQKDFPVIASRVGKAKYCSKECSNIGKSQRAIANAKARHQKYKLVCQLCKTEYEVIKSRLKRTRFCSRQCQLLYCRSHNPSISSIEAALNLAMQENELIFQAQAVVENYVVADFFFPEHKLVVFVDGDYWHGPNQPRAQIRDRLVNAKLAKLGYTVKRYWEHEINSDVKAVALSVEEAIEDLCSQSLPQS